MTLLCCVHTQMTWSCLVSLWYRLFACVCSAQVQATDADQGENGRVLYRILTGKCCFYFNLLPARPLYMFYLQDQRESLNMYLNNPILKNGKKIYKKEVPQF